MHKAIVWHFTVLKQREHRRETTIAEGVLFGIRKIAGHVTINLIFTVFDAAADRFMF